MTPKGQIVLHINTYGCEDATEEHGSKSYPTCRIRRSINVKIQDMDQKQAGLEAVGNEIQSKVEWTTTQMGKSLNQRQSWVNYHDLLSRQEELTTEKYRKTEYLTSQRNLCPKCWQRRNTLADLNSFKSMVSEQYNELVVLQREMQEENLKRESDKQKKLAEIAGEREILYDEVREMKQTLADMMSNVKQR